MKAPFSYFGGKSGMAQKIIALMPAHRVYIEPFAGSLAVFFAKSPVAEEIINDLDGAVVTFFRVLRTQPEDLARVCRLTPYSRAEYIAARLDEPGLSDLELARRFWVRVNQSFSKTAGKVTGWSITTARNQSPGASVQGRIDRFMACTERLSSVSIECCDAAGLVDRLATPDTVIYADPPYLTSTRNSRARHKGASDYRVDMGTPEEHERLAESLHATDATVILSGYPSDLYDRLYRDWWSVDTHTHTHSSNSTSVARGSRTERLWSNRDLEHGRFDLVSA